jgi:hypothetical protein
MRAIVARDGKGELIPVRIADPGFTDATIDLIVLRKRRLPRVLQDFVEALGKEIASSASAPCLKAPDLRPAEAGQAAAG